MSPTIHTEFMVDTIGGDADRLPAGFRKVAGYLTGGPGIAWTAAAWGRFKKAQRVTICQSGDSLTVQLLADVFDLEPGAENINEVIDGVRARARRHKRSSVYVDASDFPAARRQIEAAGLLEWVDWWIANWSLALHEAIMILGTLGIAAVQYASPTSNPNTVIPGTRTTLAEANADLSITLADWPRAIRRRKRRIRKPPVPKPPVRKVTAAGLAGTLVTATLGVLHGFGITHLTPAELLSINTAAMLVAGYLVPEAKAAK